ncbi:hypothetical protein F7725_029034 [Dissostichus mawsoni]|uniref:C2H2-type domain-containing protein n=1 Tax=Dissostichus mawsoni TaxID=36200 RepID=A0A7J5XHA7_DISMA|nr:hypothetical protein F7725_029034 [Dissostichus mawsoni]
MFHRKDHLKNHLHTHDPYKEAFGCQECGKSYNTKLGFKRHLALHAANSGDLTCQVCLQPFPSTVVLLEHLKTHAGKSSGGTKEKKHRCEHCERRFYTRKDVRRHMVVHTGRKDFLCQYCAQRFGRKDHLTRHPVVFDLASGGIKGELPGMLTPRPHQLMYTGPVLDTEPFPNPTLPFSFKYPLGSNFTSYSVSSQEREQNLKGELETYLMELQSSMPSSSSAAQEPQLSSSKLELEPQVGALEEAGEGGSLSKMSSQMAAAGADSLASSSSLMDFSQLFNFLPLNGPPYNQAGQRGAGVTYPPNEEPPPLVQMPPQAPETPRRQRVRCRGSPPPSYPT